MTKPLILTDKNFEEEVLKSPIPVLVDFWASWCPPCKMVEPTIKELAEQFGNTMKIAKINTDQNPKTASAYNIMGVPTFALFKNGKELTRRIGAQSEHQLLNMFSETTLQNSHTKK